MLKELKIQYNIYDENGAFGDDGIKLLIVGESAKFDDSFKARLRDYAEKGGKVILSGDAHYLDGICYKFDECRAMAEGLGLEVLDLPK